MKLLNRGLFGRLWISGLAVVLSLFYVEQLDADLLTISGTDVFNQSLGTLNSVSILVNPPATATTASGAHSHTIDPAAFATGLPEGTVVDFLEPIFLFDAGAHSHGVVDIPAFSTALGTIDPPATLSTFSGSHHHGLGVDFGPATVGPGGFLDLTPVVLPIDGEHFHLFDISSFTQSVDVAPFLGLGPLSPTIDPPGFVTVSTGVHSHITISGLYASNVGPLFVPSMSVTVSGSHSHFADIGPFSIISTTFDFTPNTVVPEPSTVTLLGIGVFGIIFYGWRRKRKRPPAE